MSAELSVKHMLSLLIRSSVSGRSATYHKHPKKWTRKRKVSSRFMFHGALFKTGTPKIVMHPKGADGMTNSVDPDQTAARGLTCTVYTDLSVRKLKHYGTFFRPQ